MSYITIYTCDSCGKTQEGNDNGFKSVYCHIGPGREYSALYWSLAFCGACSSEDMMKATCLKEGKTRLKDYFTSKKGKK